MQPFPHVYRATATAEEVGEVRVESPGLPAIATALPREFGGTGAKWSPEALLAAAIADCFVLTFRGIARVTATPWRSIVCDVDATLERVERQTRFTRVMIAAHVRVAESGVIPAITEVLQRAEATCLVTNSLDAEIALDIHVEVGDKSRELVSVA
jgi:organic hydroperoxide reductase OsmC/OhrA